MEQIPTLEEILSSYDAMSEWANCATPDCSNKVCTWSNDFLCYPCHRSIVGEEEMIRRWNETHDEPWEKK